MTEQKQSSRFPPQLVLLIGILAVSTASILIRFSQAEAPSLVIAAYRLIIASLILTPYIFLKQRKALFALPRKSFLLLVLSGFFLALHFAVWISSLEFTTVASSVVLVTTTPIWVALISPLILKEKLNKTILFGLGLAMLGSIIAGLAENCDVADFQLMCSFKNDFFRGNRMLGNLLALAGANFAAAYLIIGKKVRAKINTIVYIYVVYSFAAIFLLIAVLLSNQPIFGYSTNFYGIVCLLALIPQIIGHSTYNWALGYLPATFVSIALLGEPIGTILLSTLFLNETPAALEWIGGVLLLSGIFIASQTKSTG